MLPPAVVVARTRPAPRLPTGADLPGGCVYEPRWAGRRALLFLLPPAGRGRARGCLLRACTGEDLGAGHPALTAAAAISLPAGTVLDGALVATCPPPPCGTDVVPARCPGRADTPGATRYVAVDVLAAPGGRDVRSQPWQVRRRLLEDLLRDVGAPLHLTPVTSDERRARGWLLDPAARVDGLLAKGRAQPYRPGARAWVAVRPERTGGGCPRWAREG